MGFDILDDSSKFYEHFSKSFMQISEELTELQLCFIGL